VNLQDWFHLVQKTFEGKTMPLVALIGNKTDLFHLQAVDLDKHNEVFLFQSNRFSLLKKISFIVILFQLKLEIKYE
jgi:hypothetical protein